MEISLKKGQAAELVNFLSFPPSKYSSLDQLLSLQRIKATISVSAANYIKLVAETDEKVKEAAKPFEDELISIQNNKKLSEDKKKAKSDEVRTAAKLALAPYNKKIETEKVKTIALTLEDTDVPHLHEFFRAHALTFWYGTEDIFNLSLALNIK